MDLKKFLLFKYCMSFILAAALIMALTACDVKNIKLPFSNPAPQTPVPEETQPNPADEYFPEQDAVLETDGTYTIDASQIMGRTVFLYHQSTEERGAEDQREFSAKYGCDFREIVVPWDQYYSQLLTWIMAGDSPDVFDINNEVLPLYAIRDVAVPIDGMFDPTNLNLDFEIMNGMRYKGGTYILHEIGRAPVLLFYNATLFDRYGIDTPMDYYNRSEWTIDKLYEVARIFNDDTTGGGIYDQFGFAGTSVYEFLGANQLPLATYDPAEGTFTLSLGNERQLAVLQDALDHIEQGDIQPFGQMAADLFPQGKLAMAGHEQWFASSLGAMEDEWSVAPYPTGRYSNPDYKYIRPWGVGVASGAKNGYAGMAYMAYVYAKNQAQQTKYTGDWTGTRGEALKVISDKKSYYSPHTGIPGFRSPSDAINNAMTPETGRTASDLYNGQQQLLIKAIEDFNDLKEGWVAFKEFTNPGPVDFEDDGMGYLNMGVDPDVSREVVSDGIKGKSLRVTLENSGWYAILGTSPSDLEIVGNKTYSVSFDYNIIHASGNDPMFFTLVYPSEAGWTELHAQDGDEGRFSMDVVISGDDEGIYLVVCLSGAEEVLIDNFEIAEVAG